MADSILHSFLDNRFIKTDELEHINKLTKASTEIQKQLSRKKQKVINYTLVAFDPTIPDDDPTVVEVETVIKKHWSTFRNSVAKTKDTPIAYIQAVILEALHKLSKDENLAAIIWHSGCNIINHYKLAGQEKVLIAFLSEIGKKVEEAGRINWSILESAKIDTIEPIQLTLPEVSPGEVSESHLSYELKAAAVHKGWKPNAGGGENPHMTTTNNWEWSKFFAERAAKGLSQRINEALSVQNKSLTSISDFIEESLDSYLESLTPYLKKMSSSILQSSQSLNKRSDLIWWKESLYSSRLDSGYRTLDPLTVSIVMAADLSDNVSPIYPKSVDFFLKETLRDVLGDEMGKTVSIAKLLKDLQQFSDIEELLLSDLYNENAGRKSLGACMAVVMKGKMKADEFFKYTGLEKNSKIPLEELTVWLFHDLQANNLATMK